MNVYNVYTTDQWESRYENVEQIGIFSSVELARDSVKSVLEPDMKAVIEQVTVNKVDSNIKLEVYSFNDGLEYKSDSSDAELGSLSMAYLSSDYYEITNAKVSRDNLARAMEVYFSEMNYLGEEPEIKDMDVDEFLELDIGKIDHVLHHAECHEDILLKDFFNKLNNTEINQDKWDELAKEANLNEKNKENIV